MSEDSTACHECSQPRDNHHAVDHSWKQPSPPATVPVELRQMLKQPKESAHG